MKVVTESAGADLDRIGIPQRFPPPTEFSRAAHVRDEAALEGIRFEAARDPVGYWENRARELHWTKPWDTALDRSNPPFDKWFVGGETNICANALDRHIEAGRGDQVALIWEGNKPGDVRTFTYSQLRDEVCRVADAMQKKAGLVKEDRALIFMPMVPEAMITMLAAWRIGVTFSVVFSSFEAEPIKERILHTGAKVVFTANGFERGPKSYYLKDRIDEAVQGTEVEKVVVLDRDGSTPKMVPGQDIGWSEFVADASTEVPAVPLESNHPSFILYTSGSTGGPKGMVHSTGGWMTGVQESARLVFDMKPDDVFFCTADIGWVTGHSYTVLAPLLHGATTVLYEGTPTHPAKDRLWDVVERHGVTILYTAPTAINDLAAQGAEWPAKHPMSSLRLLGTVGEPISDTAWRWYYENVGKGRCPIVDTWWQTETGHILISSVPGATAGKPAWAGRPLPGVLAEMREPIYEETDDGTKVRPGDTPLSDGSKGLLVLTHSWPGRALTMWGGVAEQERFVRTYFLGGPDGPYVPMDTAIRDGDGDYRILGRADDVIITAGHNVGTGELENAIRQFRKIAKVIVVARDDVRTGKAIVAFVVPNSEFTPQDPAAEAVLAAEIRKFLKENHAAHWQPSDIHFAPTLMTTLSGKHLRRLYRQLAQRDVEGLRRAPRATLAMPDEFDRLLRTFGLYDRVVGAGSPA